MATVQNAVGAYPGAESGIIIKPTPTTTGPLNPSLLSSTVSQLLGFQGTAAEDTANATAQDYTAQGDTAQASAYGSAIDVAKNNAAFEAMAGNIQGIQEQRAATQTMGTQAATAAANGYGAGSVTSLGLMGASVRQSALAQQLNSMQTAETEGGYLESAAATSGMQAAASEAAASATTLGQQETSAAAIATANSANETAALEGLLQTQGPLTTQQETEQSLITSTLASPLNGAASIPAPGTTTPLPSSITSNPSYKNILADADAGLNTFNSLT